MPMRHIRALVPFALAIAAALADAQEPSAAREATPTGAVAGVVRNERGEPIIGARVGIEALALQTVTDSAGSFVLAGLPAHNVNLIVRFLGYHPAIASVGVPAGQTLNLSIRMLPVAARLDAVVIEAAILNQVAGMVTNDVGQPIPDVTVDVLGLNRRINTNADGRFLLTDLDPGSYVLQFRKSGFRVSQYALRMIAQIDRDITIKLRPIQPNDPFTAEVAAQVALETNRRVGFRGALSMVIGREELERWGTAPLGVALNGSAAGNLMRTVPNSCILLNGFEALTAQTAGSGFLSVQSSGGSPSSIDRRGSATNALPDFPLGTTGGWLNHFRANEVEMVELYEVGHENSRTLCNRFPPSSGCACPPDPGGIVIWLKR